MGLFVAKMMRTRMKHWPGRGFVLVGHDLYDSEWGVTIGWGFRPNAPEGETAWRQVWRIRICWPIRVRARFNIRRT